MNPNVTRATSITYVVTGLVGFYATRLRRNYPGYFREFRPFLIAAATAAALDFLSTWTFMVADGVDEEFHPLIRLVSRFAGPVAGPLIGKIGQLLALVFLTLCFRPAARVIFVPATVAYLYAAWYNTWGKDLYVPLFLRLFAG